MILVTGAGGKTGRAIVEALAARGAAVRALVHHEAQADRVEALGAREAVAGDLRDAAALRQAMRGIRAIYHICPNVHPDEIPIGAAAIAAAREAGVEHFAFHSVLHPQVRAMPHHWNKLRVEAALLESGLPVTILQPTAYMQNILAGWPAIVERGVYSIPYSAETRLSLVDLEDVAEAAATVLTSPGHGGATYELVGAPAMTQVEVAETLGRLLGRPVRAQAQPIGAWRRGARAAGSSDYALRTLAAMFRHYERYGLAGNPNVLGWLLRRPPGSLARFVEQTIRSRLG